MGAFGDRQAEGERVAVEWQGHCSAEIDVLQREHAKPDLRKRDLVAGDNSVRLDVDEGPLAEQAAKRLARVSNIWRKSSFPVKPIAGSPSVMLTLERLPLCAMNWSTAKLMVIKHLSGDPSKPSCKFLIVPWLRYEGAAS